MQIRLQELFSLPEHRAQFDYTIDLSQEEVGFEKPFRQPVRLVGEVADKAGAVTLRAQVQARVFTQCARCGRAVAYDKTTPVEFLFVKEIAGEEDGLRDDLFLIESDTVELNDILVPELILDMEMTVLCQEDCKGVCPKCGQNWNDGPCGCRQQEPDPRWSVLQKFLNQC